SSGKLCVAATAPGAGVIGCVATADRANARVHLGQVIDCSGVSVWCVRRTAPQWGQVNWVVTMARGLDWDWEGRAPYTFSSLPALADSLQAKRRKKSNSDLPLGLEAEHV